MADLATSAPVLPSAAPAPMGQPQVCCPCGATHNLLSYPYPSMPRMCKACFIARDDAETIVELLHDSFPTIGPAEQE